MIARTEYLDTMIRFKDKQLIKVIAGIRRCGKSTLFEQYQDWLLKNGIMRGQIHSLNLEDADYADIHDWKELHAIVHDRLLPDRMNYIFLDEVQRVEDFQKAVDSLFIRRNCDVYITGSNAWLLSGELATLLSGRYIEIRMLPLSFREYCSAFPQESGIERLYTHYLINSSFPYALQLGSQRDIRQYLDGLFDSIVLKDIVARRRFPDIAMLRSVVRFLFDNIGNLVSTKKIVDTMVSAGRKITGNTVESYLTSLTESFIFYRVGRYDIKGKEYLKTGDKYYAADIGLRYNALGSKKADEGHILENIIFLELMRRGYEIHIGKSGTSEVDFVAFDDKGVSYWQVAWTVIDTDGHTLDRELSPLQSIRDHNPKFLLTMDHTPPTSHNGIRQLNALDWLLGHE